MKTYNNFINGKWVTSNSKKTFESTNPSDQKDVLGSFQYSTKEDVVEAVNSAFKAREKWAATPAPSRGKIFYSVADKLESRKIEFRDIITRETGKTLSEAAGEVDRAVNVIRFMAGEATRLAGETLPTQQEGTFAYTQRAPHGVVGIITPWNFPLGLASSKITPALVAGNTVVFKPASTTPLISQMFIELLEESGIPEGVINFVTGSGSVVGNEFANNEKIRAVSFTGSTQVGMELGKVVSARNGKIQAEMGGKNPFVVLPDADIELVVNNVMLSAFGECGQRCTATSRLILHKDIAEQVTSRLIEETKKMVVGNPKNKNVDMGAVIDQNQVNTYEKYIEKGVKEGAKLEIGGEVLNTEEYENGNFVQPTIFTDVKTSMTIAQEEMFAPIIAVIVVDSYEEALQLSNDVTYGLSSSIYTNNLEKAFDYLDNVESGVSHVNMPSIYSEPHFPFGGMKNTTIGPREQGKAGVMFYSETRTLYVKHKI